MALDRDALLSLESLHTLAVLSRRTRQVESVEELGFVAVNETFGLAEYRQAALWLWSSKGTSGGVKSLSGVASVEANTPYVLWLRQLFLAAPSDLADGCWVVDPSMVSERISAEWHEWLPEHALVVDVPALNTFKGGLLLVAREAPWADADRAALAEWGETLAAAYAARTRASVMDDFVAWQQRVLSQEIPTHHRIWPRVKHWLAQKTPRQLLLLGLLAVAIFPVRLTVLAPAELVPAKPAVIRAPLDGVVGKVLVTPNQTVQTGDALFEFDRASLESRLQLAERALATVQADYRQRAQRALFDAESKAQLAILQGQLEEKRTEVEYLRTLNERGVVAAPQDGVVLFSDPTEWVGRPVVTGERVMVVADPKASEIEAWISPSDAVSMPERARVTLYLNTSPLAPLRGSVRYVAHEAVERPGGQFAYRVRAALSEGEEGRVGLKGTAKLDGHYVILSYWVLRRPLAAARAWLGW